MFCSHLLHRDHGLQTLSHVYNGGGNIVPGGHFSSAFFMGLKQLLGSSCHCHMGNVAVLVLDIMLTTRGSKRPLYFLHQKGRM